MFVPHFQQDITSGLKTNPLKNYHITPTETIVENLFYFKQFLLLLFFSQIEPSARIHLNLISSSNPCESVL